MSATFPNMSGVSHIVRAVLSKLQGTSDRAIDVQSPRYLGQVRIFNARISCVRDSQSQVSHVPLSGVETKQVGQSGPVGPAEPRACDSHSTEDILLTQSRQGGTFRICSSVASCGEPRIVPSSNLKCPQSTSCRFRGARPVATPFMSTGGTTYLISG